MKIRILASLSGTASVVCACTLPQGLQAPPGSAAESGPQSAPTAAGEAAPAPDVVFVTLRNSCSNTVKVFYGADPKSSSGTESSLSGNSIENHSFRPGDMMWLLDESGNGIASTSAGPGMREIEVTASCTGLSAH
jgi:hypothetical protein